MNPKDSTRLCSADLQQLHEGWLCSTQNHDEASKLHRWHTPHKPRDNQQDRSPALQDIEEEVEQEMFVKPGASQREEMLTLQVKNTMLQLNGQNVRLAAKNGRNSKIPGLHLSATHGKETVGQLTACTPTQEGTAQLDLLLLKSPRPGSEREALNQPVRRPLKLAPLELPEEVREAQRQKLKFIQQEVKPASCKLDVAVNEPRVRKVKSCVRQRLVKAAVCPSASTDPLRAQQQNTSSRPQLTRSIRTEQSGDKHLVDVACRGTPAPQRSKPAPPLLSPRAKAPAARDATEVARQTPSTLQQEVGRRRLRLRRTQCLEEDQCNPNASTGGLSADKDKLAQGVQGKVQQGERAPRIRLHAAGKGIKEPAAASGEHGRVRKNHQEDSSQQSARCTPSRQSAKGGSGEHVLDSVKPSASTWRLKRKTAQQCSPSGTSPTVIKLDLSLLQLRTL
ncbi:uncharacterized protein LOC115016081 [Cottoperca gobio]|uniref:Uncharacterized protein LOC115016081 n=1 Tax=Cottoperca gobio TaxID=56716 RepID=A0A6J2QPE3_COTGO|nr:uncharacterized protein LOC115016081 [Cottoperca gobio]